MSDHDVKRRCDLRIFALVERIGRNQKTYRYGIVMTTVRNRQLIERSLDGMIASFPSRHYEIVEFGERRQP